MSNLHDTIWEYKIMELFNNGDYSGWFGNNTGGPYLKQFQDKFAECCKAQYAFGVSSGSVALYAALRACNVGLGDKVAVPAYTHIGSVAPIVLAGARPYFVDTDQYGNFNPVELEDIKVKAIIVVHQLGNPCNMNEIRKRMFPNTFIIEDASHALIGEYGNERVGTLGDVAAFSVGGGRTKTIGTGEGGMVVTNNEKLAKRVQNIRNHGDRNTDAPYFCFNFRMSEWNAALGCAQIDHVSKLTGYQILNSNYIIPRLPIWLKHWGYTPSSKSTRYIIGCTVDVDKDLHSTTKISNVIDNLLEKLGKKGYYPGEPRKIISRGYKKLVSDVDYYRKWGRGFYVDSDKRIKTTLWIDYHRYPRTKEEIDKMLEDLKEAGEGK